MTNEKINFKKNPEVVVYDSTRTITNEEIKEHCELNEVDVPAKDSAAYWNIVTDIRQMEYDDFVENCKHLDLGMCLVHGFAGLWDGKHEGGKVMEVNDYNDLVRCIDGCDEAKVYIDKDGLHINGYHHDGTNSYDIRPLTKTGLAYWNSRQVQCRAVHQLLLNGRGLLSKVNTYLF